MDPRLERTCAICLESKEAERFRNSRGGGKRNVCRSCQDEVGAVALKTDILNAYGRKCACCGEANPLFLQLDHVNNDGRKHHHLITQQLYRLVKKLGYPKDFQLLCANCNWAKGQWGACPHQSGRTETKVWESWEAILERRGKRYRNFQEKQSDPNFKEVRPKRREISKLLSELER